MSLSPDITDDILYFARTNSLEDLRSLLHTAAADVSSNPDSVLLTATDPDTGNGALHMASANGHIDIIQYIINLSTLSQNTLINTLNLSGNTALHYAALNGHLEAVKRLLASGADPTVFNKAGHDAVFEAEMNGQDEVARWILERGEGLETGFAGKGGVEEGEEADGGSDGDKKAVAGDEGKKIPVNGKADVEDIMGGLHLNGSA